MLLRPRVRHATEGREKLSLAGYLSVSPQAHRLGLGFFVLSNQTVDAAGTAAFLRTLLRHYREPLIVIWDGGSMHHGPEIDALQREFPRLHLEPLPGYAPDLDLVEWVWSDIKFGRLANFLPKNLRALRHRYTRELLALARDRRRLTRLLSGHPLALPEWALAP